MVVNLLAAIFSPTHLQREFFCGRVVVKNVLPRLWIRLVGTFSFLLKSFLETTSLRMSQRTISFSIYTTILSTADLHVLDCPEREATYIITTGGINDPEKA